jgi:hypothetical protein
LALRAKTVFEMKPNPNAIAIVTRAVLRSETCSTIADLAEAVKCDCARLRLPYDSAAVTQAFRLVGSNRPLVAVAPVLRDGTPADRPGPPELTHAHAAAILERLRIGLGLGHAW